MKNLKDIILEKLIINKNTKVKDVFVDTILKLLYTEPDDVDEKEVKVISNWVKEENVEHMIILSTKNVFERAGLIDPSENYLEKDLRKDFENDDVEIVFEKRFYDGYSKDLGEEVYDNKGNWIIYRNNKNYTLTYSFKRVGNIFFICKK